jgi:hypothetical protein
MRTVALALLASSLISSSPATAQTGTNIVQIWQNFIASRIAMKDCGGLDAAVDARFMANFTDVTLRASQAVQKFDPSASRDAIIENFKTLAQGIHDRVDAEVKTNGCSSPRIQLLRTQYKANSAATY